ncbi:hypothetical protein RKE29_20940 [Streptomyces sp. B1866]|uniref:hypothetical protein n=1 Tax=Streptomyces sp. B1866 TaxID=3075431 RepID=UPI00288D0D74|nr:hypothetical protein [Streptomyces sp. B1866]MDT3399081.1 hypothetical protein [Streptomyces sp. B1866]
MPSTDSDSAPHTTHSAENSAHGRPLPVSALSRHPSQVRTARPVTGRMPSAPEPASPPGGTAHSPLSPGP